LNSFEASIFITLPFSQKSPKNLFRYASTIFLNVAFQIRKLLNEELLLLHIIQMSYYNNNNNYYYYYYYFKPEQRQTVII